MAEKSGSSPPSEDDNYMFIRHVMSRRTDKVVCRAYVTTSHTAASSEELTVVKGEVVDVLSTEHPDYEMWRCESYGKKGYVPFAILERYPDSIPSISPPPPEDAIYPETEETVVHVQARAVRNNIGVNPIELSFRRGDIINVLSTDMAYSSWWHGEVHGQQGLFPPDAVELIPLGSLEQADDTEHSEVNSQDDYENIEEEEHSHSFQISNKESFTSFGIGSDVSFGVYVLNGTLGGEHDSNITASVSVNLQICSYALDNEHVVIGPLIKFEPHGQLFRRPLVVFIRLPEGHLHEAENCSYAVLYRNNTNQEKNDWQDISHWTKGQVFGVVMVEHNVAALLLPHFCEFTICKQSRKKLVLVQAYGLWSSREEDVTVTCLLRPDEPASYNDMTPPGVVIGHMADSDKLVVVAGDGNITVQLKDNGETWTVENEEDRCQFIDGDLVWNGHMLWKRLHFRLTNADGTSPASFYCRLHVQQGENLPAKLRLKLFSDESELAVSYCPNGKISCDSLQKQASPHASPTTPSPEHKPPKTNDQSGCPDYYNMKESSMSCRNRGPSCRPPIKPRSRKGTNSSNSSDSSCPPPISPRSQKGADGSNYPEASCPSPITPRIWEGADDSNATFQQSNFFIIIRNTCSLAELTEMRRHLDPLLQESDHQTEQKDRLRGITLQLRRMITDVDAIVDDMYSRGKISFEEKQRMQSKLLSQDDKRRSLLEVIYRQDCVELLIELLREHSQEYVANFIEDYLAMTPPASCSSTNQITPRALKGRH